MALWWAGEEERKRPIGRRCSSLFSRASLLCRCRPIFDCTRTRFSGTLCLWRRQARAADATNKRMEGLASRTGTVGSWRGLVASRGCGCCDGCKGSKCASAVAKFVVSRQQIVVWLWLPSIVLSCGRRWALEQLEVGASSSALMVGAMERTRSSGELAYYRWTALSEGARLSRQAFLRGWRFIRASIAYLAN